MEQKQPGFFEKANQWMKTSITVRLLTMGLLILLLLIPVSMIRDLIREREYRQNDVIREVSSKWGERQTVKGLVLTVPYSVYSKVYNNEKEEYQLTRNTAYAYFLPEELDIKGDAQAEVRKRGIYEVVGYKANLNLSGSFEKPDFEQWKVKPKDILWEDAFISLGLSDLRSVQERVYLSWNGETHPFNPGTAAAEVIPVGMKTPISLPFDSVSTAIPFSIDLHFNGSSELQFVPLGKTTRVSLHSDWKDPSFNGSFLPDNREVREDGFDADWQVLHLNRTYPQSFRGEVSGITESAFGVSLIMPVDQYQKSMRSAKYAVLFITLTFLIFFFMQILNKLRIHPIQYLIVGLALCVFYTLLVALSEHIGFQWSYLLASIGIIGLISLYTHSMFKRLRLTVISSLILMVLYLFIFTIIQLQDYALLMGSFGLFVALALIMFLSRKIDWYALKGKGAGTDLAN